MLLNGQNLEELSVGCCASPPYDNDEMTAINLKKLTASLTTPWQPITVAQYNGNDVMVAHGSGAYDWHVHDNSDEFFLVLQGEVALEMRDNQVVTRVTIKAGEMFVIPQGVEHRPVASDDAYFLLIERNGIHSTVISEVNQ